ncbi:MAG: hypothetical protein K9H49_07120 [Bacteroidales bacterium]|nr:hypothetical protein [Bacteroidales bacterium]MCF8391983.1 hypothetical protein [Bacteroidales bacterium]
MFRTSTKILFLFGLLLFGEAGYTQQLGENLSAAEVFSVENGLSSSRITTNFVDSRGYLWVGTSDGLNRYDGYEFLVFKHEPGNDLSISNNHITCIKEDLKGNLSCFPNFFRDDFLTV